MSTQNKEKSKLPDKKKNDLLKKFLNAQQYTKNLKKNASNLIQQPSYATFSYDQFQTYPQIPQSAKLPSHSTKLSLFEQSRQQIYSIDTLGNDSNDYSIKAKSKKSHGHINLTQSSNQIPYLKSKKSSYSQMEKSQGGNCLNLRDQGVKMSKEYDVQSVDKEKYHQNQAFHESLGGMKTESFFKMKSKKSFNYSNMHEYDSEKLSGQDHKHSYEKLNRKVKRLQGSHADLVRQQFYVEPQNSSPYSLTPTNFTKLLNKVQQLQQVVFLYQSAIQQMKKKLLRQEQTIKTQQMAQVYVDMLKQELLQEKAKNADLREKLDVREGFIREYEKAVIEIVEGIGKHYQKEISKIVGLEKENAFLKFMLRLELEHQQQGNNPEMNKSKGNDSKEAQQKEDAQLQEESLSKQQYKINISKNMTDFKQKFSKLLAQKQTKPKPN